MTELHAALASRVDQWRAGGYAHDRFPTIAEILHFAIESEDPDAPYPASGTPRYLRAAQFRALETYWYLRLVEGTPRIAELYLTVFPNTSDRLAALGLDTAALKDVALNIGYDGLIQRIRTDDDFARAHRLDAVRETLTLDYPSWILALAMGAGKTVLIGAIVATEFAMAIEYPDAELAGTPFIENALVFAPGTTILESLRELSRVPYERILPPRLHERFAPSLKVIYTRDGERDIAVTRGSRFNLVVTNTEKIRIQARPARKARAGAPLGALFDRSEEEAREIANLRLQAIASLPHLGVFSDEAHHTYGNQLGTVRKRVRQTVDYLATESNVVAVINTTGTPYFGRQPLRDVVVWYGHEERDLAILRPDGFDRVEIDGKEVRQATISYPVGRAGFIWDPDRVGENAGDYGFHYVPYNFDSTPEADFYERVLARLNLRADEVQDVYFTGAITDPAKTDLSFAYPSGDRDARYTPDFVVHAASGQWMLVEIKMTARHDDPVEGRSGTKAKAVERIVELNPGWIVYRMVFADAQVPAPDIAAVDAFLGS